MSNAEDQSFEAARRGLPDIDPDCSVIWKPLRRLFGDGTPTDPVTMLAYDLGEQGRLPFATISKSRGNRLILWPPSNARELGQFCSGDSFAVHHLTLELANGNTHLTRFSVADMRIHKAPGWRIGPIQNGLKTWLVLASQIRVLTGQAGALEQGIRMPSSDSARRLQEFKQYVAQLQKVDIQAPTLRGDFLVTVFCLMSDPEFRGPIESSHFPMGSFWNEWVDGWPNGDQFQIVPKGVNVDGLNLILLTAAPPGRLNAACFLGSPSAANR